MLSVFASDKALLRACSRRDSRAWEEFVRRFSKLIYWAIRKTLEGSKFHGDEDLIGDIFQDAFGKIFERDVLSDLKNPGHIRKFLVVLSTHLTLDRLKHTRRREERYVFTEDLDRASEAPEVDSPDFGVLKNEREILIGEALNSLGNQERACFEFYIYEEKSHQEIGLLLGISQEAVSSIIRRAKERVREKLAKKGL